MKKNFILLVCIYFSTAYSLLDKIKKVVDALNPLNLLFKNVCMPVLGCFYTGPPFHHLLQRPISLAPKIELGTKFQLFTPSNPHESYDLEPTGSSIRRSPFNSSYPTVVLIHGFASDLNENDFRFIMKKALLDEGKYNVIIVDWTADNGFPYAQAVANTRTTGAYVATLIHLIVNNTRAKPQDFHVIGHSLGAHMAGYIGERVKNLGRITGLDPAGPYFQVDEESVRLDPSDALFVDVIHTSAAESILSGVGMKKPVGHMDFYPNGGSSQPGCGIMARTSEVILGRDLNSSAKLLPTACDHERANEFFAESINRTCRFQGVLCGSFEDYEKRKCTANNSRVAVMGFHSKRLPELALPSLFYLETNDAYPFCMKNKN